MKKINSGLFGFVFALLVCILGLGSAFAQELGDPPCCFNLPKAAPETAPPIEGIKVAQELGDPPCCFNLPKAAPETAPPIEGIKVAQELGDPPCCFNTPDAEVTISMVSETL
jgi:hypothetical protein